MNNLAIIPARGGSKRIPRKNIKSFHGKPIITYSIELAIESGLFDEIIVSTDDQEIANISIKYGASVPFFRSPESSNDIASTFDVIDEVLKEYELKSQEFKFICCIYPCAPFISIDNLQKSFKLLIENNFDTVFPVVKYSMPVQRAIKIVNNKLEMLFPEFQEKRSQDLEPIYYDAGQFYWANVRKLLSNRNLYSNNSGCIILDELCAHDIDNENDWKVAEIKYSLFK
jgi:N-acylneuraminate cytidylyltransferase